MVDLDVVVGVGGLGGHVVAEETHPLAPTHVGHLGSNFGIKI